MIEKCQRCDKNEGTEELHTCPFAQDIHDDDSESCNCCEACTTECAQDV